MRVAHGPEPEHFHFTPGEPHGKRRTPDPAAARQDRRSNPQPAGVGMARTRLRICSEPGCPNAQPESRCDEHRTEHEHYRRATTPTKATRTHAERQRRAVAVRAHRQTHGDWCPGWQRPPHQATDLTADHTRAVATGGAPDGPLQVLCRACNSAKGSRA